MRVLFIGAHPDDPDYRAGGTAKKFTNAGHEVRFVSVTSGDMGHQEHRGQRLAEIRRREAFMASGVGALEYVIMNNRDGRLVPSLDLRDELIGMIRQYNPDLLVTHRPNDYHPDHRCASQLVQDASYLLTVPGITPKVPHLRRMPVICYMEDEFLRPNPFTADVVISIDDTIADKIRMLHCHASQFYEWLPYNREMEKEVPASDEDRLKWLGAMTRSRCARTADRFRIELKAAYGDVRGGAIEYAEAFELCEYGSTTIGPNGGSVFPFP